MPERKSSSTTARSVRARPVRKAADTYHHGDLRHALVDAACVQVEREGPDSLSLAQLAKSLGVSQPAPYRHFPDRNALLAAVATRGFRDFTAALHAAAEAGPKARALSRMGQAYVAFGTRRAGIYHLMFASPILREAGDPELKAAARGSFELLVTALDDAGGSGERRQAALQIWVALHGIVMLANQGLLEDGPAAVRLSALVDAVLAI